MALEVVCAQCQAKLRVPDGSEGKRVKCPKCQQMVEIPGVRDGDKNRAMSAPSPGEVAGVGQGETAGLAGWSLRTEDGQTFGPVQRSELDAWVNEGRVTGDCHVLGPGQKQWVAAGTVYPQLAFAALTATAESPSLSSGRWQVEDDGANPKSGGELVELPAAAASAASSVASTDASRVGAVAAALRPADAAGVAMVPASDYPALHTARTFYRVLGWLSIVFGGLLIVVQVVSSMLTFFAMSQMGGDATQMFLTLLTLVLLGAVFATMTCAAAITFWFLADCIRWMLDLQNRAERTNILLEQLLRQQQQRDR